MTSVLPSTSYPVNSDSRVLRQVVEKISSLLLLCRERRGKGESSLSAASTRSLNSPLPTLATASFISSTLKVQSSICSKSGVLYVRVVVNH